MEKDLTPHIKQSPKLNNIGTKTIIIKLTRTLKDDKQSFSFLIVNFSGLISYMGNGNGIKLLQDKFETVLMDITNDIYDTSNCLFFRHDFLFWLFIKYRRGEFDLAKLVTLKKITDTKVVKISKAQSFMGNEISACDTKNITKSLPILNCLLADYMIVSSTFRINFYGCELAFQLINNSQFYFRKDEVLWDFLKIEQFIMGFFAIHEFIKIYNQWKKDTKIKGIDITQEDISAMVEDSERFSNTIQSERNRERAYSSFKI